jgi:hypothetical protein
MCSRPLARAAFAGTLAVALFGLNTELRAEPTITRGIGLASCEKLVADLKPGAGLNHLPNALLFYWVQGYMSAANISLLNEYTNYVDLNEVDEATVLDIVIRFCKANPGDKPISAIDKFIREVKKTDAKEDQVFDPWEQ